MKWRIVAVMSCGLMACPSAKTCNVNADCAPFGAECVEHLCVSLAGDSGASSDGGGDGGRVDGGGVDGGDAGGSGDGGTGLADAGDAGGDDGGGDSGIADAGFCASATCAEACLDTEGCVPYFTAITVDPLPSLVKAGSPVTLTAHLVPHAGVSAPYPTTIALSGSVVLPMNGDVLGYFGNVTQSSCAQNSVFSFVVSLNDGGLRTDGGAFACDGVAPTLTLWADAGMHQRDEVLSVALTSDEPLADAGVSLDGIPLSKVASANCARYPTTGTLVGCYSADFSKPGLPAITGTFSLAASGVDIAGNVGTPVDGGLNVTRLRWDVKPTDAGTGKVQALVVGSNGEVYAGINNNDTTGALYRLSADDGSVLKSATFGSVQSLSATNDVLFYSANDATRGSIGGVGTTNLALGLLNPACSGVATSATYSGIALINSGSTLAIGSINPTAAVQDAILCRYTATGIGTPVALPGIEAAASIPVTNVILKGTTASFLRTTSLTTTGTFWQAIDNLDSLPSARPPQQLGTENNALASGQALTSGGFLIGGRTTTTAQKLFLGQPDGGLISGDLTVPADNGTPVIASSTEAYVGRGSDLVRFNPTTLDAGATPLVTLTLGSIRTSPVLGKPQPGASAGIGYAVSSLGELVAFSQGTNTDTWKASISASAVLAHPTLDCNRASPSSHTGILYVGNDSGQVKAIIVDSPGLLDTAGAWPKYQRSAGNAGNDDTTNFPTNWPQCQ